MYLYNCTLSAPSNVTAAVVGQFSGQRQQEIVLCRAGQRLELLRPNTETGKMQSVLDQPAFGTIRSLATFRLTGGTKDYLIIGSDSGRITIAQLDTETNTFSVAHQETFGRSGSRRIVPGQYLATDPKGRAVIIGAVEKAKLVYILNRDAQANLTISSPLEAHRPNAIIHALVGVDVGFENPLFAALEVDYEDSDRDPSGEAFHRAQKLLTYYELDLGLNHVVRRWASPVLARSNHLVQVPGGYNQNTERWEGPSGVLVCSEDYITYKHNVGEEHRVPIPRRYNPVERAEERRGNIIVASVCHRMKTDFFFLLQNEDGDLFKVTIDHDGEDMQALRIKYFDTVPTLIGSTLGMYVVMVVVTGLLYGFFSSSGCGLNTFFITANLLLCLLVTFLCISPPVQEANPRSGLAQSSMVSAYCTYLIASALMNRDNVECNPITRGRGGEGAKKTTIVVGACFTFLAIAYSTSRAATQSKALVGSKRAEANRRSGAPSGYGPLATHAEPSSTDEENITTQPKRKEDLRIQALRAAVEAGSLPASALEDSDDEDDSMSVLSGSGGGDEADDERNGTRYDYTFFHLIFAIAACYTAMLLTDWRFVKLGAPSPDPTEDGAPVVYIGRSAAAMWMRVVSSWLCIAIYAWSLVAPVLLPDRFADA